jgi:multiple sugar transport system permease protein
VTAHTPTAHPKIRPVRRSRAKVRALLTAYGFLLPNLLGFLTFTFLPVLAALLISFTNWDLLQAPDWIGLANYRRLATDRLFHEVLRNTVVYVAGTVPVQMAIALLVAMALNRRVPGQLFFRTAYFMPVVASTVAVALVWRWIFHADFGLLNSFLYFIGVDEPPKWLSSTRWALPAIIIMSIWQQIGFSMVLFLAGLQSVPGQLYEAAKIDGANGWHRFRYITVPMLSSTTFFVLVISVINSFQVFEQAFIMTQGGPANATNTLVFNIYRYAFQFFQMGYAAAMAWVLFAIIFAVTLVQFRMQRQWVHYD